MTPQLLKSQQAGADVILAYGIGPEPARIAIFLKPCAIASSAIMPACSTS
jgi:hypothetical protein